MSTLAMWVAVQIATDVTETLAQKEKGNQISKMLVKWNLTFLYSSPEL